ncbi:MAG: hypothetical protein JSS89_01320 [Bacteroidetes bacterium]|nr:hypothetical protein [Bacteroidota bacterium]
MKTFIGRLGMGVAIVGIVILASMHQAVPTTGQEAVPKADTTPTVSVKTLQKPGFVTVKVNADSSTKISLMKYRIEGTVLSTKITGIVIDSGATMMMMKVTPYGTFPPFQGSLPAPGIADQPIQVVIMSN